MTPRRPAPPLRYVYVIGPEYGWQKVGIATDPRGRLAALQTASPNRLRLHASIAVSFGAAHCVEARAHVALRPWVAQGEWFAVTPAEAVAAVMAAAGGNAMADQGVLPLFARAASQVPEAAKKVQGSGWFRQLRRRIAGVARVLAKINGILWLERKMRLGD